MRRPYSTDLTDTQWQVLQPLIPPLNPAEPPERLICKR